MVLDAPADLVERQEAAAGGEEQLARDVDRAGIRPPRGPGAGAGELSRVAGVDELPVALGTPRGRF